MERRRLHEAQHVQARNSASEDQGTLTAGYKADEEEEEEEKEIDPSIVGSLDDVYKDDPNGEMKEEDPFKKVPVMADHEKPMMEMEKSFDAMVALVGESPESPLPEDATSLDRELRKPAESEGHKSTPTSDSQGIPDLAGATSLQDPTPVLSPTSGSSSSPPLLLDLGESGDGLATGQQVDPTPTLQPAATSSS